MHFERRPPIAHDDRDTGSRAFVLRLWVGLLIFSAAVSVLFALPEFQG